MSGAAFRVGHGRARSAPSVVHAAARFATFVGLLACSSRSSTKEKPVAIADASVTADAIEIDAAPAQALWKFSDVYPLLLKDCPLTLPLAQAGAKAPAARRIIDSLGPTCFVPASAKGSFRQIDVELAEQAPDGSWHDYRLKSELDTGGMVYRVMFFYGQPGTTLPNECQRIGAEVAAYGQAMMGLSDTEAARIGATFQQLLTARFDGFRARVPLGDRVVNLIVGITKANGEAYCAAGLDAGGEYPEEQAARIVDVPLAPMPEEPAATDPSRGE
ncbi:MAG: hypothetical protein IPJ61_21320 [Tessaracoccus sp.]|uniref:hypothetical protein n=1 Tax=Tessaracoccus sp. TaxID=1971211 RepID=UPI001ECE7CBA|nr:hypothetical protein [Tessaracoccus sp.]MBK7823530.1 hypothetical protein [Tessaracoccus sp.]